LVAIYHYFKWVETKVVDYDMKIVATFFENEIIYQFRVLKNLLTYNGGEWMVELNNCAKTIRLYINTLFCRGLVVMAWLRG